jgi:hypothetical protein
VEGDVSAPSNLQGGRLNRRIGHARQMGFEGPKPSTTFRFRIPLFPKCTPAAPNPALLIVWSLRPAKPKLLARPVYRELFQVLARRDVSVRQTDVIGVA